MSTVFRPYQFLLNCELENKFKKSNFNTLVFRARKKLILPKQRLNTIESVKTLMTENEVINNNKTSAINTKTQSCDGLKQSLIEWRSQTGINIPERQALRLESHGINTEALVKLKFTKTFEINKYLTQLEVRQNYKNKI